MIKHFEIRLADISQDYRFEPAYYLFSTIIKTRSIERGVNYCKLGYLCSVISDGEHSAIPRQKEPGVRYLYGRNIKDGFVNFDPNTDSSYIKEADYDKYKRIYLEDGDVLLTIVGTIGKTAIYKQQYIGVAGIPRHIAKIRLKENTAITPEYLMAFFLSKLGKWQLNNITTGNIQPLLSIGNIEKLEIPIIKTELLNGITTKCKTLIERETLALRLLSDAQKVFYNNIGIELFKVNNDKFFCQSKENIADADLWTPTYSCPLYVNTIKNIQSRWQTLPLGDVVEIIKGDEIGSDSYSEYLDKKKTDIPFVRTSDIVNYELDHFPDYYASIEDYEEINQAFKSGDVLFTKDGKIGMVSLMTDYDKVIISSGIVGLRINKKALDLGLTPEYIFLALSIKEIGIYASKRRTVIASTIPHLREERLKEIEIPILNKETISEITNLVKQAFTLKDEKRKLLAEVREKMDSYFEI